MSNQGLSKSAQAAVAAGYGCHYGDYVAARDRAVTVVVPEHLRDAPTMFERLAGAKAPSAPKYGHVERVEPAIPAQAPLAAHPASGIPKVADGAPPFPTRPDRPMVGYSKEVFVSAPWLREKRKAAGVKTVSMANHLDISVDALRKWEQKGRVPEVYAGYIAAVLDWYINYAQPKDKKL